MPPLNASNSSSNSSIYLFALLSSFSLMKVLSKLFCFPIPIFLTLNSFPETVESTILLIIPYSNKERRNERN
ncbi:hypothetical protein [Cryptosporidium hominis TU502]|uniref:hypothetical protein n=1 Tax=Cryptosporidium hominis (strain TU502) TaxID=353151 RepID=UPI0000453071|nr:hypothetical protein [Cryptosporidium hominis TU502]